MISFKYKNPPTIKITVGGYIFVDNNIILQQSRQPDIVKQYL